MKNAHFLLAVIYLLRCSVLRCDKRSSLLSRYQDIISIFFLFGATAPPPPQWARASSFTRFLDHTQRRTTVGRTPLDE